MQTTPEHNRRIAALIFADVYPHYIKKIETKGRTIQELHEIIFWLTGFNEVTLDSLIQDRVSFEIFFNIAVVPPEASLIKGLICGYRVEEIENPLTQKIRYLDKLIDELAKGKSIDKILRR